MDDSMNEDVKYCLGCLSHSNMTILYCYKLQIGNLKILMQDDCLYLCYICKRLMQKAEQFIECVNNNQLAMQNLENIKNISQKAQYQLSEIENIILEKTELNDENFDDPIYTMYSRSIDNKIKGELKEENVEEEFHDYDSSIQEPSVFFDSSVKEENIDADDNMCLYELREVLVKSRAENEQIKSKTKNVRIRSKENDLPLNNKRNRNISNEEDSEQRKIKKYKKSSTKHRSKITNSENGDLVNSFTLVSCTLTLTREQIMLERAKMLEDPKYVDMMYKCDDCVKGFRYKEAYDNHMLKHNKTNGDYECDICKQRMKTLETLLYHQRYHKVRYKCIECDLIRIDKKTIREHYTCHHMQDCFLYKCSVCSKDFKRQISLRKHMVNRHTPYVRQECKQCQKNYSSKEALKTHVLNKHLDKAVVKKEVCKVCGAGFTSPSRLKAHMMKHVANKNFYCVECNRNFKSHYSLKQHLKIASPHVNYKDLPFQCEHCDKRFSIKRDVSRHMNRIHLNIKPYQCDKCDKAYVTSSSLTEHTRFAHEGYKRPKKYPCPMCDRVFDRAAIRKTHIRTHTGERPYKCEYCEATFSQSSIRATHVRLVHMRLTRDGKPKRPPPERE